jgi:P-type Ca2+ transporter type 2C
MSHPHAKQPQDLLLQMEVSPDRGLSSEEAAKRLADVGPNKLVEERQIRFLAILREEVTEPMILLLLAIGVIYGYIGYINGEGFTDSITIIAIVAVLVLVEVYNEYRAKRSVAALKQLASPTALVVRNGKTVEVPTLDLVPGDILLLKPGDRVPADARLLDAVGLEVDESSLTGESFPASKDAASVLAEDVRVNEQQNMVFAGTIITRGRGKALITSTGIHTELGRVAGITKATREPRTPLQQGMKQLSKTLVWIAVFFSILIPLLSYLAGAPGSNYQQLILTGLALAFVVIPEEMPIIITMVLGVGAYTLSKKHALVKRLRAAETLGSVTIIATDKTGTITEGKMHVSSLYFDGKVIKAQDFKQNEKEALKTALLASDAVRDLAADAALGNPMAQAIQASLRESGVNLQALPQTWVLKDELSFDNKRKLASYIYQYGSSFIVLSSGAPENILANSAKVLAEGQETALTDEMRKRVSDAVLEMARSGERLLAFGYRRINQTQRQDTQNLERDLVFVGVVGFVDPPRKEVRDAILTCQGAGIKVIMITGDHPETARAVARQVGINSVKVLTGNEISKMTDDDLAKALRSTFVFARTTPEDKLRLVRLLKESGEVVAVTGDGINDAPALKEAHIGIAMGIRGTDVAKETADMVLADDNFATIAVAVKEGRKIFANLRKGVRYYLACKVAIVATFLLPIALGLPLPFAPIQIIVLELFMDLAASATFVSEPEEAGIMRKPPVDPNEKFMNRSMMRMLIMGAVSLFAAVSTTYLVTWYLNPNLTPDNRLMLARTVAFATWMLGHIFLALNFRSEKEPLAKLGVLSNKVMVLWSLLVVLTLAIGVGLPLTPLGLTSLNLTDWALVVGVAFVATFWLELKKLLKL